MYFVIFLEDVIIDFVYKFCNFLSIVENFKDKEILERDFMGIVIKFVNVLIGEFRKSEIKVLVNVEEMFLFLLIDKEIVNKVFDFVYDEVIEIYGFNNV